MNRLVVSCVALVAVGAVFASGGCVSVPWQYHSEKAVQRGDFPKKQTGLLSIVVGFDEMPDDLEWEVELTVVSEESGRELVLVAPGQNIVHGKSSDKVPLFFSLPKGKYSHKELALRFPKSEESLYNLSKERVTLVLNEHLPRLEVAEKSVVYLGEVNIDKETFVPGEKKREIAIKAVWNPNAPMFGNIWARYREKLGFVDVKSLRALQTGGKWEAPSLLFDQTTDSAVATLNSGFSDVYALILLASDRPGYAFFDDGKGKTIRLKSKAVDDVNLYALPASVGERFSLRGLCFADGEADLCPLETTLLEPLFNQREFQPGEIRYRGMFKFDAAAGRVFPLVVLRESLQASLKKLFPFASVHSYVLGENPFVKEKYEYLFFTEGGEKNRWDSVSLPFIEALSRRVKECEGELRRIDPFITSTFELSFALGDSKKMETVVALGKGGIIGPALEVLKPCLDSEMKGWVDFEKGELASGFGVRFK